MDELSRRVDFLHSVPFLVSIEEPDLTWLASFARSCRLGRNDFTYHAGEPANALYIIQEGRLKVSKGSSAGREVAVGVMGPCDFVGCCAMLDGVRMPCTACAVEPVRLLVLPRERLTEVLSQHPAAALQLTQEFVRRLRGAHSHIKSLALDPVERRVIAVLVELGERFSTPKDGESRIPLPITRQQIAELSGASGDTVCRVISKLRRNHMLRTDRRNIILTRSAHLARLAAEDDPVSP